MAAKASVSARAVAHGLGGVLGDKSAASLHHGEKAFVLQFGIGALDGVEIDGQRHGDLAHGGKPAPGLSAPRPMAAAIWSRSCT